MWKALVVAVRGVIIKDANKIDLAHLAVSDVFQNVTTGDGFYADGSFIFHNYFPYNGGYGVELLENIGLLMQLLSGTHLAGHRPGANECLPLGLRFLPAIPFQGCFDANG